VKLQAFMTARTVTGDSKDVSVQAFAGQRVGVKQVEDKIWLVSFMRYALGFFDRKTCRIESASSFAAKLSYVSGMRWPLSNRNGPP
jgi:hypothetical protein